jgi:hypothetical protein
VQVWNYETGKPVGEPILFNGDVTFAKFSPNGQLVISGGGWGQTKLTNAETGELLMAVQRLGQGNASRCAISPDRGCFAVVHVDTLHVVDAKTGTTA